MCYILWHCSQCPLVWGTATHRVYNVYVVCVNPRVQWSHRIQHGLALSETLWIHYEISFELLFVIHSETSHYFQFFCHITLWGSTGIMIYSLRNCTLGAGKMAQQPKPQLLFQRFLIEFSTPTYPTICNPSFRKYNTPFWLLWVPGIQMIHKHTYRQSTQMNKTK